MTAPRQVLPGKTYLVTRRCFQRQLLLRPSPSVNETFRYVLALAARRYGVLVHAFCVLSNHFHLVVTDPDARLPAFGQYLDALVARAVNASLGRWESFWAPSSYSAVALQSPADGARYIQVCLGLFDLGRIRPGRRIPRGKVRTAIVTLFLRDVVRADIPRQGNYFLFVFRRL